MRAISTQAPRESWLLRTRRYLASRIYPAIFADYAMYRVRSGNLDKRLAEQARELQALRDERELLLDMISAKDERLALLESDNERLERELSTALEARDRAKAQWRSARGDCNALYEHIHQTRRSKRRQARPL